MTLYMKNATDGDDILFYLFDWQSQPIWTIYLVDDTPGKMRVATMEGKDLLHVNPAIVSLNPKYHISIGGVERVRVVYKAGFTGNPTLTGAGGWSVLGEACTGAYSVVNRDQDVIFSHERKWGPEGEYVQLEVPDERNSLLSAGLAAAIDQTIAITPEAQPV